MRRSAPLLAALALSAACANTTTTSAPATFDAVGSFKGGKLEIVAEGGIAALAITHRVSHDDRAYLYTLRHLCQQNCPAALDSASGTLSAAAADSLFNIVLAQSPFSLQDDYGTTKNAADMMTYTLTVTTAGGVKTIRADDGTMPQPMRRIVESTRDAISAARR